MPWREHDEACPDAPAADAGLECFSLVDGDLEPAQELPYLIQSRIGEVAAKRCAEVLLEKLNEPEVAVVACVEEDAMRHTTLGAKPFGHRVRWREGNSAEAANLPLLPHPSGQSSLAQHGLIVGEYKAKTYSLVVDAVLATMDCVFLGGSTDLSTLARDDPSTLAVDLSPVAPEGSGTGGRVAQTITKDE